MRKLITSALVLFAASAASAQMTAFRSPNSPFQGIPASVTSIGFNALPPPAASITSIRPDWSSVNLRPPGTFNSVRMGVGRRGRNHFGPNLFPSYSYPYYAPVYPSYYAVPNQQDEMEAEAARELRKTPAADEETNLDRLADRIAKRLENSDRYGEHYLDAREHAPKSEPKAAPQPEVAQQETAVEEGPATLLIFRDGRQEEIRNFAIMGDSLYVLSDKRQKIALADLDVEKTIQANDERGITIRLPKKS